MASVSPANVTSPSAICRRFVADAWRRGSAGTWAGNPLSVGFALTRNAREFLRSRGQVGALIPPDLAEVDLREIGDPSLVLFFADFNIWELIVLSVKGWQKCHAADQITMFPDPLGEIHDFVRFVQDRDRRIVICPVELVVQPVVALFDGAT